MLELINSVPKFNKTQINQLWDNEGDQIVAFQRENLIFVFNFNGQKSFVDYGILAPEGVYKIVLNTDNIDFGGFGSIDETMTYFTLPQVSESAPDKRWLRLYIPARTALVLRKQ